jgi:hypothetical protein
MPKKATVISMTDKKNNKRGTLYQPVPSSEGSVYVSIKGISRESPIR